MKYLTRTLIIIIIVLIGIPIAYYSYADTRQIEVTGTERISNRTDGYYLVYTTDGTFKNVDTALYFKWDSSDVQGKLIPSHTVLYTVKVNGCRIPFLSMYKNIISIKAITPINLTNVTVQ